MRLILRGNRKGVGIAGTALRAGRGLAPAGNEGHRRTLRNMVLHQGEEHGTTYPA